MEKISIGAIAEKQAEQYLIKCQLTLIQRNFRSKMGEIDLIMQDADSLVFVEVRYRKNDHFGGAAASVDTRKQRKLIKTAQYYLAWHPKYAKIACRFDVVCIQGDNIEWLKNAFMMN